MAYICGYDRTTKVNAMDEDCRGDVNGVVVVATSPSPRRDLSERLGVDPLDQATQPMSISRYTTSSSLSQEQLNSILRRYQDAFNHWTW
jgi:hypothetical protein